MSNQKIIENLKAACNLAKVANEKIDPDLLLMNLELLEAQTAKGGQAEVLVMPKIAGIQVSKEELEYFKTFACDNPKSCGNGAICNSCWIRKWAEEKLSNFTE